MSWGENSKFRPISDNYRNNKFFNKDKTMPEEEKPVERRRSIRDLESTVEGLIKKVERLEKEKAALLLELHNLKNCN